MDDVTWGALTFSLTVVGGFYTWWAYKNRGATPAIRGLALTLLPAAAWLTGTLQMFTRIADAVSDWAVHLVLSPKVWLGLILLGVSVALFFLAGMLGKRGIGGGTKATAASETSVKPASRKALPASKQPKGALDDDALGGGLDDEIADILKRRGIS